MIITVDNTWPATLPLPFIDYSGVPQNQTIFGSNFAFGIERRSRFTRSYCQLAVTWHFSDEQMDAFKAFLVTLGTGASKFSIELMFPRNTTLTDWIVRMENSYNATFEDGVWVVQMGLELLYPVLIGEGS